MKNRLYEGIALMMKQRLHIERSLAWCLALIRDREDYCSTLTGHVQMELTAALEVVSIDNSKRGLLAGLLCSQLSRRCGVLANDRNI